MKTGSFVRFAKAIPLLGCTLIGWLAVIASDSAQTPDAFNPQANGLVNATAIGSEPLGYYWHKDGNNLIDGGNISGTLTPSLLVSHVLKPDEGGYSIVISNSYGSVTSAVAALLVDEPIITIQPTNFAGQAGASASFGVTAVGTEPLIYQWWKDGTVLAQGPSSNLVLTNLQSSDVGNYWVAISTLYGRSTSIMAHLTVNLATLDREFNARGNVLGSGPVSTLAVQTDGKVLVGGNFNVPIPPAKSLIGIGRLDAKGVLETNFNPRPDGLVNSILLQPDGKILVGGQFIYLGGQYQANIGRLLADGIADTDFTTRAQSLGGNRPLLGSLALQADGHILLGGYFNELAYERREGLGRLHPDGSLDDSFTPEAKSGVPTVTSLVVQADGKILVGGYFNWLGGQPRNRIGRLEANGNLDENFKPEADGVVFSLAVQADGLILVGGGFTTLAGQACTNLGRLHADGSLDNTFNPGPDGTVYSLAVQTDGKILVGGRFMLLGGQPHSNLGRLHVDGRPDGGFDPAPNSTVKSLAVQANGKILVGGGFTMLAGQPFRSIGRLNNPESATQSLAYDGSTILWLRGGASPEVWRTEFDCSTNSVDWRNLGAGLRVPGSGWRLDDQSLPDGSILRARGFINGSASSWFVQTMLSVARVVPPRIVVNDSSFGFKTNRFGFNVIGPLDQAVVMEGSTNLLNWVDLSTNILGATPLYFNDPQATKPPTRFFRMRTQ